VTLINIYDIHYRDDILWALLKERDEASNISHGAMPTMAEHVEFVGSRPYRYWWFITTEEMVGAIYITDMNEIGVQVLKKHRRNGYATAAIDWILANVAPAPPLTSIRSREFLLNIKPGNNPGFGLAKKLGFRLRQITYEYKKED